MGQLLRYKLHVIASLNGKRIFDEKFSEFPVTFGRDTNSSVPIAQDPMVSGHHATVVETEDHLTLIDLDSSNGTFVNGKKIHRLALAQEQSVNMGGITLKFSVETVYDSEVTQETTLTNVKPMTQKETEDVAADWGMKLIQRIPNHKRALQATLRWKDEVVENHVYYPGENVYLNNRPSDGIYMPSLRGVLPIAKFDGQKTNILVPGTIKAEFFDPKTNAVRKTIEPTYEKKLKKASFNKDDFRLYFENHLTLTFAHIESPKPFSQIKFFIPERLFQKSLYSSSLLHALIIVIGLLAVPQPPAPKIKNVPDRIARLLVKKPKPKPKPKVEKPKPPEPKKVAKKKPKPKVKAKPKKKVVKKVKPKKVVVRKTKKMKKINKYPFTVKTKNIAKKPVKGPPSPKKNVKQLGALAALGALGKSTPNPSNKPVAININKNAGGAPGKMKANSVIGALKTKGGKLVAGGSGSLKTKGKGYGTGTGYGVQGIKGSAGQRGVGATVVGAPRLMKINKQEGLTQKQVMDVVKKHAGKISSCYERALLNNPGLSGRVEYTWRILPVGKVTWAKVKSSNIANSDELNNCVVKVFQRMKFPKARNGQETIPSIGFPFGRL